MLKKTTPSDIVFTDLDGTLLNHDDYSFEAAKEMLEFLKSHHTPLIIVTSKTKSEVMELQKSLELTTPFIVENGGGIIFPNPQGYTTLTLGYSYDAIRKKFKQYAQRYTMHGFGDMSVEDVSRFTGLGIRQAQEAKERLFSEPFILKNAQDYDALKSESNKDGLDIIQGGRFYHLITHGQDKAVAVKKLIAIFEKENNVTYHSIALGDSANDIGMLQSVDTPILIPHLDGSYLQCKIKGIKKAQFAGAKGWNSALKEVFHA